MWPEPLTFSGTLGRLEPLTHAHAADLAIASAEQNLHDLWYTTVPAPDAMAAEIDRRLGLQAAGSMLPFAICSTATNAAVGMTTYMNIDASNRRVEIGSTWYAPSVQRTGLNTQIKTLMLTHAFETLDCIAVEFRTHRLNRQSRAAIERLGAQLDGILRNHMILPNGTLRDTAVYSITASDWPAVKAHLDGLASRRSG